ncbi:alkaline phosphatase family protein [Phyllobacterium sophorae]|uniref:Alkaline phosphatase family protein n=1 Tax=Phyllobacterium sophorae TaxID=1520277 RepID=A0A2P7AQG8_9HYPH|nr:nucleotide pyrophosphatase/phosphodiesterase family protein [Phyllobacterium sophorae]PSH56479.1 hypothetical protein CU103_29170 [Phyllobacterium sophorae]
MSASLNPGQDAKFLIVSFDGLRSDIVNEERTPNLLRLAGAGVRFSNHRTVFPSESMVAYASLVTGAPPADHGIVANNFADPGVMPGRRINTGSVEDIDYADRAYGGKLFTTPTLGDILRRANRRLAVISGNSPGCTRLVDLSGVADGGFSFCYPHLNYSYPRQLAEEIAASPGLPEAEAQAGPSSRYLTDVFLRHVWPSQRPDLTVLIFNEPDTSFHGCGLGSPESIAVIKDADTQLGRILDFWQTEPGLQLIVMSDHGHIAQVKRVSVRDALEAADLPVSSHPTSSGAIGLLPGHVGKIYVPDRCAKTLDRIVEVLSAEPWCGMLIAKDELSVPGAIRMSDAFVNHPRAPDLYYTLRGNDSDNRFGIRGVCFADDDAFFDGAGYHGGLHIDEMSCLAVAAGSLFKRGHQSSIFSGITDIAPTILSVFGVAPPPSMKGRVLREAFADSHPSEHAIIFDELSATRGKYRQTLRRVQVDGVHYLDHGLIE